MEQKRKQTWEFLGVIEFHSESHKDFSKRHVKDNFEKNLENIIHKYQK